MNNLINISFLYYNKALDLINENNISAAKKNLEKAAEIYLKDIDILNLLGLCEYYLCNFNKANYYWNKSIRLNSNCNSAYNYLDELKTQKFNDFMDRYNIGLDYFEIEKYVESIEVFESILELNSCFIEIYEILIVSYLELDDINNASKYIKLLSEVDSGNESILNYKYELSKKANKIQIINTENNSRKSKGRNYKIGAFSFFIMTVTLLSSNIIMYTDYQKEKSKNITIKQKLEQSKLEYEKLEKENKQLEENNLLINFVQNSNAMITEQKEAEKYYFEKEYKKSLEKFKYILEKSKDYNTKADAIYFIAASETKLGNINEAKKYYKIYINSYGNGTAYDEVLYNYALILNDENEIEEAKEIAMKLRNNYKNSKYNNSKIDSILNK